MSRGTVVTEKNPMQAESTGWLQRNQLGVFTILAFALSWWPWPLVLLNPASEPMVPFGPILAAFIVAAMARGRAGVKDLLRGMAHWRVGIRWYAAALLLPLGVTLAAVYANALLGAASPAAADFANWYVLVPAFLSTTLVGGPFTEEPGWRGFALPRLQAKFSALVSSLILGLIWFSWHLPLLLTDNEGGQRPLVQYFVIVMAISVLFTWLYRGTKGSTFLAILMHGAFNTFAAFFFPIQLGAAYGRLWWLYAGFWIILASIVAVRMAMVRARRPVEQTLAA